MGQSIGRLSQMNAVETHASITIPLEEAEYIRHYIRELEIAACEETQGKTYRRVNAAHWHAIAARARRVLAGEPFD